MLRAVARRGLPGRPALLAALVVGTYIALGFVYSFATPIFEAPDEAQHFFFVREIVEGHGLPVQQPGVRTRWEQEGSQPPLYYLLGAALTFWIDASDWPDFAVRNPYAVQGDPLAPGSRNVFLHGPVEAFPWRGTVLAVHLLRLMSLACGAASIAVTFIIARLLFPRRPALALGAAAIHAFLPQFVFISAAVNNDVLAALVCGAVLWQSVRVASGTTARRADWLLGILCGLAALTKLSGAALGLVALAALLLEFSKVSPRSWRRLAGSLSRVGLAALAVAGWWYARNLALYGDVTGLNRMLAIVGTRNPAPDLWQLLDESEGLRLSFWGMFGWFSIPLPSPVYALFDAIAVVALAGLCLRILQYLAGKPSLKALPAHSLLPLTLVIVLLGVMRWGALTPGLQGRLLFPALAAVAVLFSAGLAAWSEVVPPALQRAVARHGLWAAALRWLRPFAYLPTGLPAAFPIIALLAPLAIIAPAYARPAVIAADSTPPLVRWGDQEQIEVVQVEAPQQPVYPGDTISLAFHWLAPRALSEDYTLYVKVFGQNDELLAGIDTYPGNGMFPTTQWPAGQVIVDRYHLRISPAARVPTYARVVVGFYRRADSQALAPFGAGGQRIVKPVLARVKIWPTPAEARLPTHLATANFGDQIALAGYDLAPGAVILYWQALQAPAADYTVFVHALDRDGRLLAQSDGQPQNGDYPTSAWAPGEQVPDEHTLAWPPQTARIEVGLYSLQTGARLPLAGQPAGAFVIDLPQ